MVNFGQLRRTRNEEPELDPIEIFRTLPKPAAVNDLWDTQAEALRTWHGRRDEHDVVIKLNTGSGKTLVGLLVAEAIRRQKRRPSLYLAPTRQLVDQVVAMAGEFGLAAEPYVSGVSFSSSFQNGDATLVATYPALFNGRTRFGLLGREEHVDLGAIVLDDAHASAPIVRDIFSVSVKREDQEGLYRELAGRFRYAFGRLHMAGRLDDMLSGRDEGVMEVPYWAWLDAAAAVREQLQGLDGEPFVFSLPLVRDHFEHCHALVSHEAFTITPILPPVHVVPSFSECSHRVFMSATIADDGLLVRTFGADADCVSRPITTRSVAGLGERMILVPKLSGLSDDQATAVARTLCTEALQARRGAVVLVPSAWDAERWRDFGDVHMGDDVGAAVARQQDERTRGDRPPVFVNRYDGIDLPQDACRVLVMDGKPRGANQYDLYRGALLSGVSSINIAIAQRVEQGMGRGTRGAGDYCVVLLLGQELVAWLGRTDAQQVLTPGTRAQVSLGREIAGHVTDSDELVSTARQCFNRDDEWKQVHAQRIADAEGSEVAIDALIAAGRTERRAFEVALHQEPRRASDLLCSAAEEQEDGPYRGWLLQLAARYAHLAGEPERAEELQASAYAVSRNMLKPQAQVRYRPRSIREPQAARIVELIEQYAIRSAVLEAADNALVDLHPGASANRFEEAVRNLGAFLGFESERPESTTRHGPDNLWIGNDGPGFVIECKHQKETPVSKRDHGQLRVSVEWFHREYGDLNAVPVIIHPDGVAASDSELLGSEVKVLTFDGLSRLKVSLKAVLRELAFSNAARGELEVRAAALLREQRLTKAQIATTFFDDFDGAT